MQIATTNNVSITMTSLEMVDFINSQRGPGEATLRHDDFMRKVPKVLGEAAPKFFGVDTFTNGTGGKVSRNIYVFPKREACLMAMSYSYELQAKVFDRMTALEEQVKSQAPALTDFTNPAAAARAWADAFEAQRAAQAALSVAQPKALEHGSKGLPFEPSPNDPHEAAHCC